MRYRDEEYIRYMKFVKHMKENIKSEYYEKMLNKLTDVISSAFWEDDICVNCRKNDGCDGLVYCSMRYAIDFINKSNIK